MNGPGTQGMQRGVLLALATAAISGLSVYLNAFGVKLVSDAAVYTTAKNAVAAVVLVSIALLLGARHEATSLAPRPRLGVLAIAVIGGSVPFVLFFSGLAVATAPTAAFIHKTMFIWVAFMAVPLLSERLGLLQVGALGVLLAGQALIAPPIGVGWGPGETMILAATLLWSVEVVLAKRLLAGVSAPLLAASRMGLGFLILVGYLVVSGRIGGLATLTPDAWLWVMVTGGLLSAYVITWYSALRYAPATVVTSLLVGAAVITGLLTAATAGKTPSPTVVAGYLLVLLGVGAMALVATRPWSAAHARRDPAPA
jgi:drug/metabolite transporter (DMT)-like permease